MATAGNNLSEYDPDKVPNGKHLQIGIVVAEWNGNITEPLLHGAKNTLIAKGVAAANITVYWVPGSYELPLGAQFMLESTPSLDGVICLGCVIQGETKHFDFVCEAVAQGVKDVGLKYNKPVIFGVLTDNLLQQSLDRSGGKHGNKGDEAAVAFLKMAHLKHILRKE